MTVPVAFAEADALPGLPAGRGLAIVGWAMRAATLGVSPAVGAVGGALGPSVALPFVVVPTTVAMIATVGLSSQLDDIENLSGTESHQAPDGPQSHPFEDAA